MPPTGKLPDEELEAVEQWIADGAVWPEQQVAASSGDHWAFEPIVDYAPPPGDAGNPIDRFLDAQLEAKGIAPAPEAGKLTLLRRAKFDLHGLPPTIEAIDT